MAGAQVKRLRQWLRSPRLVVAELALVVVAGVGMTLVPQAPSAPAAAARFVAETGTLGRTITALQLDRVLHAWWFLATLALAAASLAVVSVDQWRSASTRWRTALTSAHFATAAFRRTWVRRKGNAVPPLRITSSGRAGTFGLPLLHTGLLVVIAAGAIRALCGADAVVDLYEGETLAPSPGAYGAQWPGPLAAPFSLAHPLVLEELAPDRYTSGALRGVQARVRLAPTMEVRRVEINRPLGIGDRTLYLTQIHGPAVLLEANGASGHEAAAILLRLDAGGSHTASAIVAGLEIRIRGELDRNGAPPVRLDCRVLRDSGLLFAGALGEGDGVRLADGGSVAVVSIRRWTQFTASRDPSWPLAVSGFVLTALGAVLVFCVVRVDEAVSVEAVGDEERVDVAMRVQRFAPLFAERFERLVRANGWPGQEVGT